MEGRFNGGSFALPGLGGLYLEGLIHGGAYFGNFTWVNFTWVNSENKPQGLYFSKALFEGLIFGGVYLRTEICISEPIGLALWLEVHLPFLLCFTLYLRAILQVQAPGGLIFGGVI